MRELTEEKPKCLVEVKGKTLLDWQLFALRDAGIQEIAIVTGYLREMLTCRGLVEFHNPRWAKTQMVSSLVCADEWLKIGPCIVSYSDIFYGAEAIKALIDSDSELAITYDPNWLTLWESRFTDPLVDAETFRLSPNGFLKEIGKKPKSVDEVEGQYMGLLRICPKSWSEILRILVEMSADGADRLHMTGMIQKVIMSGRVAVQAIPYSGEWGEIDSSDDLGLYQQ
jgi:choline kinase